MNIKKFSQQWATVTLAGILAFPFAAGSASSTVGHFELASTYHVSGSVAEIVDTFRDGNTLVYTDSEAQHVGFVDISDPANPQPDGTFPVSGSPTSVSVTKNGLWALVAVRGTSNHLVVIDLSDRTEEAVIPLGGEPDSVAVSQDGRFAAIAIENARDEDVNGGAMPQPPPGFLTIVDTVGAPGTWTTRDVALVGLADRFPTDPEPEFVDINANNQAAVTLQENNHVVIVDLPSGTVVRDWSTGTTSHRADLMDDGQIVFDDNLRQARREPDAIVWTPGNNLMTANEGDYDLDLAPVPPGDFVGGRNFSIFRQTGSVVFDGGVQLERRIAEAGLYDDTRSDVKGCEPEGAEVARYGSNDFAFIGAERCRAVAVYGIDDQSQPDFIQILETGSGSRPEGLLAIPQREIFVSANEGNGTISIFEGRP